MYIVTEFHISTSFCHIVKKNDDTSPLFHSLFVSNLPLEEHILTTLGVISQRPQQAHCTVQVSMHQCYSQETMAETEARSSREWFSSTFATAERLTVLGSARRGIETARDYSELTPRDPGRYRGNLQTPPDAIVLDSSFFFLLGSSTFSQQQSALFKPSKR